MKKSLFLLFFLSLLFSAAATFQNRRSIVVGSSMEQFRGDALQEQLSRRFPGRNIIVTYMPTGKAAAKVYTEGAETEIDILVGMETGYLNRIKPHLADISGCSSIPYLSEFRLERNYNKWVTWEKQAGAIVINREILKKNSLPRPVCYQDLLRPEYAGLIAMPDPKSSGTGYFFFKL